MMRRRRREKSASVSSTLARAISASSSACTASYTARRAATESCGSPCRRASKGLNSTAGSAFASNSAAGSRRHAATPEPTA